MLGFVDEKHGAFDIVFFAEFTEEHLDERSRGGRKEPDVKQIVRLWVSSGVQPELLVVDPNHCFVERDLIRALASLGL